MPENGNGLTIKQRKFVKAYAKSGEGKAAAIKAGYSSKTAKYIASELKTKPAVVSALTRLMDRMGISDKRLLTTYDEALRAVKQFSSGEGYVSEVPDHAIRLKSADKLMEFRHPETKSGESSSPRIVNIIYGHEQAVSVRTDRPEAINAS